MSESDHIESGEEGHVESVRKEFAVKEDGVLAYRLQEREIEDFYSENVRRNRSMREDVRIAKQLEREDKSIAAVSREIEMKDREVAQAVQVQLMRQESQIADEQKNDEEIARQLQLKEERKLERRKQKQEQEEMLSKMQPIGLPIGVGAFVELPPISGEVDINDARLAQEVQDSEYAQVMNGQEEIDRKIAIEQQDEELARHLQQKEKDKARKREQKLLQQREEMMRLQQQHHVQQQQPLNALHSNQQLQQAPQTLQTASHVTQHQRTTQQQPAPLVASSSPNTARKQSLPGNQTQPHEAAGRSATTRSASATELAHTSPEQQDSASSTVFTYNTTLSGQKEGMSDVQLLAKRNYKRGSSKKK